MLVNSTGNGKEHSIIAGEEQIRFLIIRFSSIGDIVLTSPVVRCLKKQVRGAIVHYLTKPEYAEILEENPYIDKVHILKNYKDTVEELLEEGFDYLIDLHKSLRSLRFKNKLKIVDFSFPKLNKEKWLLVNFKINKLPDIHIVDRYFEAVKIFDVENDNKGLDFFIKEENKIKIQNLFPELDQGFVAFAIGGQHETKKLPVNKITEICNHIKYPILLLGGKNDRENGEMIKENSSNTYNLCGNFNLQQSASILSQSKLVITHDTGLMHIAAAFKKNIISVWGNTVPAFGMYPYLSGEESQIFEVEGLKCRPCSKIGYEKCPKKHFKCMEFQNIDEIVKVTDKIMSE
jgi:ADP-heptose:LPS heptosyltransferase